MKYLTIAVVGIFLFLIGGTMIVSAIFNIQKDLEILIGLSILSIGLGIYSIASIMINRIEKELME